MAKTKKIQYDDWKYLFIKYCGKYNSDPLVRDMTNAFINGNLEEYKKAGRVLMSIRAGSIVIDEWNELIKLYINTK